MKYKLVDEKTGREIQLNETLTDFRGDTAVLTGLEPPHKPSASGKVVVLEGDGTRLYYAGVYGLKYIKVEE